MQPRRHYRRPTDFDTTLGLPGGRIAVRVENITCAGAAISGADLPDAGTAVELALFDGSAAAKVRWRRDRIAGLEFVAALDDRALAAVRRSALSPSRPRRTRRRRFVLMED
ncbi:hypothetical protein DXV76_01470 [Rhodobacteraceae bacterium CCMM004]|nr:hypothetical protein DXV76_01470 [Rhodobacteraceae bacterium CCMM004]